MAAALFFLLGDSWLQMANAVFLAFMFGQCTTIAHDAGHRQISNSRMVNAVLGYIHFDLLIGMSFGWWVERHRRHHTYPNDPEHDPDVINKFIAFTTAQLGTRGSLRRRLSRYQAIFFFPGLFLAQPYAMHFSHAQQMVRSRNRGRIAESCLLTAHFSFYIISDFIILSPVRAIVFLIVQQGFFASYLGLIIAPNHKGMEIQNSSSELDFLTRQLRASRNVRGGAFVATLFGGLNYQIEHHLFPSMPTPCLRRAKPIVRAYCQRHGLPYVETGIVESYEVLLTYLHSVGRASSPEASGTRTMAHLFDV